jgi:hypothetical protein
MLSIEQKKKLQQRIERMKSQKDRDNLKTLMNIIHENNPELSVTNNKNGIFIKFDNLAEKTYTDIINWLEQIDTNNKITSEHSDDIKLTPENNIKNKKNTVSKKLKLTNAEMQVINKIKYHKILKENEENKGNDITENTSINDIMESNNKNVFAKVKK